MAQVGLKLKYLFRAEFGDGSVIEQTPEDRSLFDPERRSRFFDVCEKEKESTLIRFSLIEQDGSAVYSVDLNDGHFEVVRGGGEPVSFRFHESAKPLSGFRLIFFRRHKHRMNISGIADGKGHFAVVNGIEDVSHEIVYRMGWEAADDQNKRAEEVMEID